MKIFLYAFAIFNSLSIFSQIDNVRPKYLTDEFIIENIDSFDTYYIISAKNDKDEMVKIAVQKESSDSDIKYVNSKKIKKLSVGHRYFFYLKNYLFLDYRSIENFYEPLIFDNKVVWTKESIVNVYFTPNLEGLYYKPFSLRE